MIEVVGDKKKDSSVQNRATRQYQRHIASLRMALASNLVLSQGPEIIKLLETLHVNPMSSGGDWVAFSKKYESEFRQFDRRIGELEDSFESLRFTLKSNAHAHGNNGRILGWASSLSKDSETCEELFEAVFEHRQEVEKRTTPPSDNKFRPTFAGAVDEEDEDDEDESNGHLPPGVSLEDLRSACLGSIRYIENFAHTLISLTRYQKFEPEIFDARAVAGEALSREFVGNVTSPDAPVYIEAEREELESLIMLVQGMLNHFGYEIENEEIRDRSRRFFDSKQVVKNPLALYDNSEVGRTLKINEDGNLDYSLTGIARKYFDGVLIKNFNEQIVVLTQYCRLGKKFHLAVKGEKEKGTLTVSVVMESYRRSPAGNILETVDLSGLTRALLFDDEAPKLTIPWSNHDVLVGTELISMTAPDELFQDPRARDRLHSIGKAASRVGGPQGKIREFIINFLPIKTNDSKVEQFLNNQFCVSLYGKLPPPCDCGAAIGKYNEPRLFLPASSITLPGYFDRSRHLIEAVTQLVNESAHFSVVMADKFFSQSNSLVGREYIISTLELCAEMSSKFKEKKGIIPQVKIGPLHLLHENSVHRVWPQRREDICKMTERAFLTCPYVVQFFDAKGRELMRGSITAQNKFKRISLDRSVWAEAFNTSLLILRVPGVRHDKHKMLVEFSRHGIMFTPKFASDLIKIARDGDMLAIARGIADYFLDPNVKVRKGTFGGPLDKDNRPILKKPVICFYVGKAGESVSVVTERVI